MSDNYPPPPPPDDDDPMNEANDDQEVDEEREFAKQREDARYLLARGIDACTVCGGAHRPTQCPLVRAERVKQTQAERAMQGQMVATAALAIRERYLNDPIWKEAA